MSDDLTNKVEQLKDMLNNEKVSDNLKNVMSLLSDNSDEDLENKSNNILQKDNVDKIALVNKFKRIIDKKSSLNDPRINLLYALKPYLSSKRQQRVEGFIKLLNFTLLSTIIKEEDF